jgi:hypothetical protein
MNFVREETFYANIWLGLQPGYETPERFIKGHNEYCKVKEICQKYVEKGLCVTVTKTEFIYTGGNEPGVIIGMINYPRFPKIEGAILQDAFELAFELMTELDQFRCTVVTPDDTILLENMEKIGDVTDR